MEKIETGFPGLFELRPRVFTDERGWFMEALNLEVLAKLGIVTPPFVQFNHSKTSADTFRGLHFQKPPFAQAKYVRCIRGRLLDSVIDIRKGSPTYGECYGITLSDENQAILYVPQGFAHGFYAITDCELEYAVFGAGYHKEAEAGVCPLTAQWSGAPAMNARDASWPRLDDFDSPFVFEDGKVML